MEIQIDRTSKQAIYRQIAALLRGVVRSGEMPQGARLPATRVLARQLGVHRHTIVEAYRVLEREGLLRSGVGAGTFVNATEPGLTERRAERAAPAPFSWTRLLRDPRVLEDDPGRWQPTRAHLPQGAIQLTGAIADRRLFPVGDFADCMRAVLADASGAILDYSSPEGDEALRNWVVEWLQRAGVENLDVGRVFIVSGSQQGLDILARLFLAPGDPVVLEAPTYTGAFLALRHAGARIVTVPVVEDGLSAQALDEVLSRTPVKFLYTMPGFQNPTGICMSAARRVEVLELARRHSLAIVEDHFDSDLVYWGDAPRPLLADDHEGQVIHLGTFSKMLFPGLRLGWMVVPRDLADSVRQVRWAIDLASATLTQRAMACFCQAGHLDRHLARVRRVNGRRLKAMLRALENHFPAEARWTRPSGGLTLWVELPDSIDTRELLHRSIGRGVIFSPGGAFYPDGSGHHALRLSFNRESEARIERGVAVLGELITERLGAARSSKNESAENVPLL